MSKSAENIERFESFIASDYDKLVNYVRKRMRNYMYTDPEDVIQDVTINIYSKLDINAPIENLAGYFYRALRNRIYDLFKKPRREYSLENYTDETEENYLLRTVAYEEDEIEQKKEKEAQYEMILESISKLKEDEQYLIIETEFHGRTFEDLSEEMGSPVGTLLSKKHRALVKINKMLNNNS
jgi:RNA polymerase sigma factor (sigma-70 family)